MPGRRHERARHGRRCPSCRPSERPSRGSAPLDGAGFRKRTFSSLGNRSSTCSSAPPGTSSCSDRARRTAFPTSTGATLPRASSTTRCTYSGSMRSPRSSASSSTRPGRRWSGISRACSRRSARPLKSSKRSSLTTRSSTPVDASRRTATRSPSTTSSSPWRRGAHRGCRHHQGRLPADPRRRAPGGRPALRVAAGAHARRKDRDAGGVRSGRAPRLPLFQGYFFARPVMISARNIPLLKINFLRLLNVVNEPTLDFSRVEAIVKQEISIAVKLLRHLNSAAVSGRSKIHSIRHALVMLGEVQFRRWISLLALTSVGNTDTPGEVIRLLASARPLLRVCGGHRPRVAPHALVLPCRPALDGRCAGRAPERGGAA